MILIRMASHDGTDAYLKRDKEIVAINNPAICECLQVVNKSSEHERY